MRYYYEQNVKPAKESHGTDDVGGHQHRTTPHRHVTEHSEERVDTINQK